MKTYSIIVVTLTLLFFFIYKYGLSKVTKTDENYIVLDKFNDIEIREYKNQLYTSFTPKIMMKETCPLEILLRLFLVTTQEMKK